MSRFLPGLKSGASPGGGDSSEGTGVHRGRQPDRDPYPTPHRGGDRAWPRRAEAAPRLPRGDRGASRRPPPPLVRGADQTSARGALRAPMSAGVVVDASVALKLILKEEHSDKAEALLNDTRSGVIPSSSRTWQPPGHERRPAAGAAWWTAPSRSACRRWRCPTAWLSTIGTTTPRRTSWPSDGGTGETPPEPAHAQPSCWRWALREEPPMAEGRSPRPAGRVRTSTGRSGRRRDRRTSGRTCSATASTRAPMQAGPRRRGV